MLLSVPAWWSFLREELEVQPGRLASVTRMAISCCIVVAVAMLYRIPLPAYAAYVVLLVSREESTSTLMTGAVSAIAATLAVGISILLYMADASEPGLRIPLMAASTFLAMYLSRVMTLGPVAFLLGYVLVMSQTIIDEVLNLEALTRLVLWLWVVVVLPDAVTVLINLLFGETPKMLVRQRALALLSALSRALGTATPISLAHPRAEAIDLLKLRRLAGLLDRDLRRRAGVDAMLIETLLELLTLHRLLPAATPADTRLALARSCDNCHAALLVNEAPIPVLPHASDMRLESLTAVERPVVVAMGAALARLSDGLARRHIAEGQPKVMAKGLFVPDAFTNPGYPRFAAKATLAVMASYITYNGLDWPGISTAVTTCFFVALGTLGETMHKLTLRILGAAIGGLAGGLCIVYLLPEMTDIGQLCLLIAAVSVASGWVATSSDRLSYAGLQIAFAFFLGVLQGYGSATDLTVLRDRVVGIMLGNLVMSLVFGTVWPVSAKDQARAAVADALRALGRLLAAGGHPSVGARVAALRALGEARRLMSIASFELQMLAMPPAHVEAWIISFDALDRLAAAVFVMAGQKVDEEIAALTHHQDAALAAQFEALAAAPSFPDAAPLFSSQMTAAGSGAIPPPDMSALSRAAMDARALLQSEIQNALIYPT